MGAFLIIRLPQGDENLYFVLFRGSIWDDFFKLVTQLAEPFAITLVIVYLLFRNFRQAVSLLTAMAVMLLTSAVAKLFFQHYRPALYFNHLHRLEELVPVDGVQLLTGDTSFPSGHTMGAFTIFTLLALQAKQKKLFGVLFLILASGVGLSRIYLGQHFLKDVMAGSILGVVIALIVYVLFERLRDRPKWNRNLIDVFRKEK